MRSQGRLRRAGRLPGGALSAGGGARFRRSPARRRLRRQAGWGEPVRYVASPKRDLDRGWFYESRNEVLFAWNNVPMPDLVLRLAKVSVNALRLGFGVRRPGLFARGLAAGFAAALRGRGDRRPVSREAWRLYERLGRRSARIEEIEAALPKERS